MSPTLPATGFGLLGMTWRPQVTPDSQAFAAMRAAVANGATVWSTSSAYGLPPNPPTAGLLLLRRYFDAYPEDALNVTLFVRGCYDAASHSPVTSRADVLASFEECQAAVGPVKKIDVFGPARMDRRNVPVEETIGAVKELIDQGRVAAAGLSEVSADTIRAASKICPIAMVEIEFSLWSTEMLDNGVAAACKENNVAILAYAPLGYGFLTGKVTKLEDIPEGDLRHMLGRFQPDTFPLNLKLVEKVKEFAARKGATPAQLALAWVRAHSNVGECGVVIPIPGATAADRVKENCKVVELTTAEKAELDDMLKSITVVGARQIPGMEGKHLWT
ncbi:voltage-gated shaker-like K+ channel, subunit [Podospora didyma]|uniref:Voltage-gated shaker-like K+ channel, subunit n=1 Tax=Podospora didyma TaxID=330526 RepID=A0AAE0K9K4_9PEZI|nr:voltage-gated shaker-like K+ channel, subunit [Podospora didyma]